MNASRISRIGIMTALACVMGYVEMLIPLSISIPGIKPGFSNIIILAVLYLYGIGDAAIVSILRIFLTGFMFGSMSTIMYSVFGASFALFVMYFVKKSGRFSMIGVSSAAGAAHNLGQLLCAAVVLRHIPFAIYLPYLVVAGTISGVITGCIAFLLVTYLPKGVR